MILILIISRLCLVLFSVHSWSSSLNMLCDFKFCQLRNTWNGYRTVKISYYCNPSLATYHICRWIWMDCQICLTLCDPEAVEMWASGREVPDLCWESGSSGMLKGQGMEAGNGRSWSDHRNEKCVYVTIFVHVHMNMCTFSYLYLSWHLEL